MNIGINAISAKKGGILTYTCQLINYLEKLNDKNNYHIWVPNTFTYNKTRKVILHRTNACDYRFFKRFLFEQIILRRQLKKFNINVFFSSANFAILFPVCPQILMIRNNVYFNKYYRKTYIRYLNTQEKIEYYLHIILVFISIFFSHIVLFPSESIKNDFERFSRMKKRKFIVNHYGIKLTNSIINKRFQSKKQYMLLYVSEYYLHKNPEIIIKAYWKLKQLGYNLTLRITMKKKSLLEHLKKIKIDGCVLNDDNIIIEPVNKEEKKELLYESDIFIFPSECESFGFPMIEAMNFGLPMIVSDTSINREICGNAALYFRANNHIQLVEKIGLLLNNKSIYNEYSKKSIIRSKRYNIEKHIKTLIKIFNSVGKK